MKVKDVMSTAPLVIHGDETCHDAAPRMCGSRVRHRPVVAANGALEDILTDRVVTETDLLRHIVGADAASADVESIVVSYP